MIIIQRLFSQYSTSANKEAEAKEFGAHYFQKWDSGEGMKALEGSFDLILSAIPTKIDWDIAFNLLSYQKNGFKAPSL